MLPGIGCLSTLDYHARMCALTGDENCCTVQDEMHMVFECQHSALSALQVHLEELFAVKARGITPAHSLQLFMNHRDVISVAKFVQQLLNYGLSNGGTCRKSPNLETFPVWNFLFCFFGYSPMGFKTL